MVDETVIKALNLNKLTSDHFVECGSNDSFEIGLVSEDD